MASDQISIIVTEISNPIIEVLRTDVVKTPIYLISEDKDLKEIRDEISNLKAEIAEIKWTLEDLLRIPQ